MDEISRLQVKLQRTQETLVTTRSHFEEELELRCQRISRLENKLEYQKDYDDIKREIDIIRSIDLSQIPLNETGKNLEQLIIQKSIALQQIAQPKPCTSSDAPGMLIVPIIKKNQVIF